MSVTEEHVTHAVHGDDPFYGMLLADAYRLTVVPCGLRNDEWRGTTVECVVVRSVSAAGWIAAELDAIFPQGWVWELAPAVLGDWSDEERAAARGEILEEIDRHAHLTLSGVPVKLSSREAYLYGAAPLAMQGETITYGMVDPRDEDILLTLTEITMRSAVAVEMSRAEVFERLDRVYPRTGRAAVSQATEADGIRLWDYVSSEMVRRHAQDAHVRRFPDGGGYVQFVVHNRHDDVRRAKRIDEEGVSAGGLLLSHDEYDMFTRRLQQVIRLSDSGAPERLSTKFARDSVEVEGRVMAYNVGGGWQFDLRVIGRHDSLIPANRLGMNKAIEDAFRIKMRLAEGFHLAVGPPSSGKNTTLLAFIGELPNHSRNTMTIERPVEIRLPYVTHLEVEAGEDPVAMFHMLLSCKPSGVYVSEINGPEMAQAAVAAAMAGFQLWSTAHGRSAISAPERFIDLGIGLRVVEALSTVLGQRVVRRLCTCREPHKLPVAVLRHYDTLRPDLIAANDAGLVYGPRRGGCGRCGGTGYSDLIGVFELLDLTLEIKNAYKNGRSEFEIETLAREGGFRTMVEAGVDHIIAGLTSYEALSEVLDTGVRAI